VSTTIAWRRPNRSWDARGEVDVDHALAADLDADEPAAAGHVDQPRDLEPTQSELVGNPDLRSPVQVVAAPDEGREHERGRSGELLRHDGGCVIEVSPLI
jgi:hypothetical protein